MLINEGQEEVFLEAEVFLAAAGLVQDNQH